MVEKMNESLFNKKNKLAILILAHKNVNQLNRLINTLEHQNIDIFIHLDKKWVEKQPDLLSNILHKENIFVCDKSVSASLDHWSLVEATLELIKKSLETEKTKRINYKYFALLSGQDYPVKKLDYILNELSKTYPKPHIDCTPYDEKNWVFHKFHRLLVQNKLDYFLDSNLNNKYIKKGIKIPLYSIFWFIKRFYTPYKILDKMGCKIYGGSAWWILPDMVIKHIMDELNQPHNKEIDILKHTFTPEETFFQIMTMKSSLAYLVDVNPKDQRDQNCKTYAHFTDESKPFTGHPYIITNDDFDMIKNLEHFFVRKFDETVDKEILKSIDESLMVESRDK